MSLIEVTSATQNGTTITVTGQADVPVVCVLKRLPQRVVVANQQVNPVNGQFTVIFTATDGVVAGEIYEVEVSFLPIEVVIVPIPVRARSAARSLLCARCRALITTRARSAARVRGGRASASTRSRRRATAPRA
jgi:hypothetical protein